MTIPVPLAVRLSTARAERHITADLRDLSFRTVVPGGFASATFSLDRPLAIQPDEIAYYGNVYVYDTRNGQTVWEGRLEDPGRGVGGDGQIWAIAAVGPSAHARDRTVPLIFVDRSLEGWYRVMAGASIDGSVSGRASQSTDPGAATDDVDALLFQWNNGTNIGQNAEVRLRHSLLNLFDQKLAAYDYNWDAGRTHASLHIESISRAGDGTPASETNTDQTWATGGGSPAQQVVVTDFANGHDAVDLRIRWSGAAATVGDEVTWLSVSGVYIKALLHNADGTEKTTGYGSPSGHEILASDVVKDLLGRLLTKYDGANASVTATTYQINHLAYPDGATPDAILADLIALEPDFYWAAWESNSDDKHRFEWRTWPTTIRYEADVVDGFDAPGSASDLYNAVTVRYRDLVGKIRRTTQTQTVAVLDDAGLTRTAHLDLSDNFGSSENAVQAGQGFLDEHATPPNRGTLTIARPILDMDTGRMVQPWEIRPGHLIRVRGVLPKVDALNATARDGVTVFKVVATEYNASSASATLELDSHSHSVARSVADLTQGRITRRR